MGGRETKRERERDGAREALGFYSSTKAMRGIGTCAGDWQCERNLMIFAYLSFRLIMRCGGTKKKCIIFCSISLFHVIYSNNAVTD